MQNTQLKQLARRFLRGCVRKKNLLPVSQVLVAHNVIIAFLADFARGTGCGLDYERVWSGTTASCGTSEAVTIGGSVLANVPRKYVL